MIKGFSESGDAVDMFDLKPTKRSFSMTGSQQMQGQVDAPGLVFLDPIGAIAISIYIIVNWCITGWGKYITYTCIYTHMPLICICVVCSYLSVFIYMYLSGLFKFITWVWDLQGFYQQRETFCKSNNREKSQTYYL